MQMRFVHKFFARMKQTVGTFFFFFLRNVWQFVYRRRLRTKVDIDVINGSLDLPIVIALIRIRSCVHRRTHTSARATFIRARSCASGTVRLTIINNPVPPAGSRRVSMTRRALSSFIRGAISTLLADKTGRFQLTEEPCAFRRRRLLGRH